MRAGKSESQASTFQAGAAAAINTGKAAISIFPRVLSRLLERLFHLATIPAIIRDWDVGISHRTARAWHSFLIYAMRRSGASLFTPMFGLLCACSIWKDKPYSQCFGVNDMKCLELNDFGRNGIDQTS